MKRVNIILNDERHFSPKIRYKASILSSIKHRVVGSKRASQARKIKEALNWKERHTAITICR